MRTGGTNPFRESVNVLGLYVRGQAVIFCWEIVLYSIGFAMTGIPWWGLMAVICALLGWVPHLGTVIGIGLVLLAGAIGGQDLAHLGLTAGVWALIQSVEAFWLAPRLLGKRLGLRPLAVFLALLVGSLAFGPLGLLFAVPILAVAMVWIRYFRRTKQQ